MQPFKTIISDCSVQVFDLDGTFVSKKLEKVLYDDSQLTDSINIRSDFGVALSQFNQNVVKEGEVVASQRIEHASR